MILADTSVLIDYYRPQGNARVREAVKTAIRHDLLAVNGIIQVEILGFAVNEKESRLLAEDFAAFHWLPLDRATFDLASKLGFDLRSKGRTVPATDLIVAASAFLADAELLHMDRHFEEIRQVANLVTRNPAGGAG